MRALLTADQQALAASMGTAWTRFAANGSPSTHALSWPAFSNGANVLSLQTPQSQTETSFAADHHCSFWAVG